VKLSQELLDRLHRAAWALSGSAHDADDLVQETFAQVLARPRRLRRRDPAPYLMRALRNTHLTGVRKASRRPRMTGLPVDDSVLMASSVGQPQRALEQREAVAAIATLPREFRLALVAVDVLGLSQREAARALDVREPTIGSRVFRAREQLALALAADG
jgi:RNA polymerase sigma-70 factor (ECF subfamily)